jgi:kinesin family protein C2/C3
MINLFFLFFKLVTGGDSKALMFVQISPSDNDVSETLSSLNFASRVRGIELGPAKKQVDTAELQKVKQMVRVNIAFS